MKKFYDIASLWFCRLGWAGLSPCAPGTAGSLVAVVLAPWLFLRLDISLQALVLVLIFILGSFAACRAEIILKRKDPSQVVIDELLGQWTAVIPISLKFPVVQMSGFEIVQQGWGWLLLGFILFRVFDILKPWPIKASENWLPGGFGIMLDDLIAGVIAGGLLYGAIALFG